MVRLLREHHATITVETTKCVNVCLLQNSKLLRPNSPVHVNVNYNGLKDMDSFENGEKGTITHTLFGEQSYRQIEAKFDQLFSYPYSSDHWSGTDCSDNKYYSPFDKGTTSKTLWNFGQTSAGGIEPIEYKKMSHSNSSDHWICIDCVDDKYYTPVESDAGSSSGEIFNGLLLIAVLFATITFSAGLHPPGSSSSSMPTEEVYLNFTCLFMFFNSLGYFISMAMIILLLQNYPLKPWPTLGVVPLLGSYICSVMAILPNQGHEVLILASSIALFAAAWMCRLGPGTLYV